MSTPTDILPPALIVGVGASAGGLQAFRQLLSTIPVDTKFCFILVQHLEPTRDSSLANILALNSPVEIVKAVDGEELLAGRVLVVPSGVSPTVADGELRLTPLAEKERPHRIIDEFFSSLAREYGPRAAAVVLSGTGSDGARGVRELRQAGGLPIVQAPETAQYRAMPENIARLGGADLVVPIAEIYTFLTRFSELPLDVRTPQLAREDTGAATNIEPDEESLRELARLLKDSAGFDLDGYKRGTVLRRLSRRMALSGHSNFSDYLATLRENPQAVQRLLSDLLISVTEFFRDKACFEALRSEVIEPTVRGLKPGQTLRAWVAGCATGEEAYSIAMLLLEAIDAWPKRKLSVQLFATDIDESALAIARRGIYAPSAADKIGAARLKKFFHLEEGQIRVTSRLRDAIAFARHDIVVDPPFSRMHLVSCRNLLIYLRPERQQQVLEMLHFALRPNAYLMLGISETVARDSSLFSVVHPQGHIYKKVGSSSPFRRGPLTYQPVDPTTLGRGDEHLRKRRLDTIRAQQAILNTEAPPSLVLSPDNEILFSQGDITPFLQFPQGHPHLDLLHVVRPGLLASVRTVIHRCRRDGESVTLELHQHEAGNLPVRLNAHPADELTQGALVLSFHALAAEGIDPDQELRHAQQEPLVEQLKQELSDTREELQTTVDQLDVSNEKLHAVHEESLSMNEELQAANEELEASSEELRSLNAELAAVNRELRDKIEQVEEANNDLINFFASSRIATIFLNRRLRMLRSSPAARELFGRTLPLEGRPIAEIDHELLKHQFTAEVQKVLDRLTPVSHELRLDDGRWFTRRILPYRTDDERITGVVVTFIDVTDLKVTAKLLAARQRQQALVARLGLRALESQDLTSFMSQIVADVAQATGADYCMILEAKPDSSRLLLRTGIGWSDRLVGNATVSADIKTHAGYTLRSHRPVLVDDLQQETRFSGSSLLYEHGVESSVSCVIQNADGIYGVLSAHSRKKDHFTDEDADFVQSMGALVAAGVSRHYQHVRAQLESETGRIIATAIDIDEAMRQIHQVFTRQMGTTVGEYWVRDREEDRWVRRVVTIDEVRAGEHSRELDSEAEQAGRGLITRIMESNHPEWMTAFVGSPNSLRTTSSEDPLLRSGLALPVLAQDDVQAMLAVYSQDRLVLDPSFSESLLALSRTLGEFVLRARSEAERRRNAARLTEFFETVGVGLFELDYSAVYQEIEALRARGMSDSRSLESYLREHPETIEELIGAVQALTVNQSALLLLDAQEKSELIGSLRNLFLPESRETFLKTLLAIANGHRTHSTETRLRTLQDRHIDIKLTLRFPHPSQDHHRVLVSMVDITEIKRYQAELQMASEQKDQFLAMLGHELRNPLAAVYMATQMMSFVDVDDENLTRAQEILDRQTSHMSQLLDGLLDVSRVVRGKIALDKELIDLREIVTHTLEDLQDNIRSSGLDVHSRLSDQPVHVEGDRVRLTQIVDNLLSNALKYTSPPGQVIVSAGFDDEGQALISVEDTGIGIDEELMPQIFDTFRQSDQSIDRSAGGLGLGLPLVRGLVDLHDGEITVESDGNDKGSRFCVHLPRAEAAPTSTPTPHTPNSKEDGRVRHVLIIEDNPDIADSMAKILELRGSNVSVAYDGPSGITQARQSTPDLILCDIGLPGGMSGFDVAHALREDAQFADTKLVAITGYGRTEDRLRSLEAGFDAHLTKPVELQELLRLLE